MEPTEKQIRELKEVLEKQHGREFSWEEATQAVWDMIRLAKITFEAYQEEKRRQELLEKSPKGFHFDRKGYTCQICQQSALGENSWYDKYGLKCITCQEAINRKIIPGSIAKNKDTWYSKIQLELDFNIKGSLLKRLIKQGEIKDRIIPGTSKAVHLQLFLLKDNKDFLPPKKLIRGRVVTVEYKGEPHHAQQFWYEFQNPFELLKKYRIVEHLREAFSQPMNTGRFLAKKVSPLFTPKS